MLHCLPIKSIHTTQIHQGAIFPLPFLSEIISVFEIESRAFLKTYLFLNRGEGRERGRETSMCGSVSRAPYREPGPQPRPVP